MELLLVWNRRWKKEGRRTRWELMVVIEEEEEEVAGSESVLSWKFGDGVMGEVRPCVKAMALA